MPDLGIDNPRYMYAATGGTLLGGLDNKGLVHGLGIIGAERGQFDGLTHLLCALPYPPWGVVANRGGRFRRKQRPGVSSANNDGFDDLLGEDQKPGGWRRASRQQFSF